MWCYFLSSATFSGSYYALGKMISHFSKYHFIMKTLYISKICSSISRPYFSFSILYQKVLFKKWVISDSNQISILVYDKISINEFWPKAESPHFRTSKIDNYELCHDLVFSVLASRLLHSKRLKFALSNHDSLKSYTYIHTNIVLNLCIFM